MSTTTPLLVITNAGLQIASVATATGPWISITNFSVGDAYGYTPTPNDTGLNGNLLYSGTPTSYTNIGNGTIDIVCQIPPDAGPFNYGEVGIFVKDQSGNQVLFAKAAFDTPQTKYSSLGTNVATSETFHCLLTLNQSIAVIQMSTLENIDVIQLENWSDVVPPALSAYSNASLIIVTELDNANCSTLLQYADPNSWTVGTNYEWYKTTSVINSTTTSITVPATDFYPRDLTSVNRQYVIETSDGYFRSCLDFVQSGSNYMFDLNPAPLVDLPTVGEAIRVYLDTNITLPPLQATYTQQGVVQASDGIIVPSPGTFQVHGLLHDGLNTGRVMTTADNLNTTTYNSGIYTINSANYPSNMPVASPGQLWITNASGTITQVFIPVSTTVGYYRSYTSSWLAWRPLGAMTNNNGSLGSYVYSTYGPGASGSETNNFCSLAAYTIMLAATGGPGLVASGYINGTYTANAENNSADPIFIGGGSFTMLVPYGSTFSWTSGNNGGSGGTIYYSRYAVIL
jgi:hypothetical protein